MQPPILDIFKLLCYNNEKTTAGERTMENTWDARESELSGLYESIAAYVPESVFFEGKNGRRCRRMHDDCAVLDVSNEFRILVSRGFSESVGTPFFSVYGMGAADAARLQENLRRESAVILIGIGGDSFFFFPRWFNSCGLLLVLRIHATEAECRQVLDAAQAGSGMPIFSPAGEFEQNPPLLLQLTEIFYYTDHMFTPTDNLWSHVLLLANFVGCKMEYLNLPILSERLTDDEFHRLTAFLLCLLLSLRIRTGRIHAAKDERNEANLGIHIEQRPYRETDELRCGERCELTGAELPFLEIPSFRRYQAYREGDTLVFDLSFPNAGALHAGGWHQAFCNGRMDCKRIVLRVAEIEK